MDFLDRLLSYDKENITPQIMRRLKVFINNPQFNPDVVSSSSKAARSLCMWCIAMYRYAEVLQIVRPKRERVEVMKTKLQSDMEKLKHKQNELRQVEDNVKSLRDECAVTETKVQELESGIQLTMERIKRAGTLLELLADEGVRWKQTVEVLGISLKLIEGNVFLATAEISYLGPFTGKYRQDLKEIWIENMRKLSIPISDAFDIENIFGNTITIRD